MRPLATFEQKLDEHGWPRLARAPLHTLQVNVGRRCNQACQHCHVEAGPRRTEEMDAATAERVLELLAASPEVRVLDITGGAPELHACFRRLASGARALGREVIDRCNLTVLFEPGQQDLADFLARERIAVLASLPCYRSENLERQRGKGVFEPSIEGLRLLNRLGYGLPDSPLRLDLVYNPLGATLPPPEAELEAEYRIELRRRFGIEFHQLYGVANMPIKRFADWLERSGEAARYHSLLVRSFNPDAIEPLMCRRLVSVGYDGQLYDCDFNQMLELPLGRQRRTVWDIASLQELADAEIATDSHCFGCTAGAGSSCGGALVKGLAWAGAARETSPPCVSES